MGMKFVVQKCSQSLTDLYLTAIAMFDDKWEN